RHLVELEPDFEAGGCRRNGVLHEVPPRYWRLDSPHGRASSPERESGAPVGECDLRRAPEARAFDAVRLFADAGVFHGLADRACARVVPAREQQATRLHLPRELDERLVIRLSRA